MKKEDVLFCKNLLISAAKHVLPVFENQKRENNLSIYMANFHAVNDSITSIIRPELEKRFPSYPWSEDEFNVHGQHLATDGTYWVCDTLDGGINFMQGLASWCITLALVENGEPIFAMIYEPLRKDFFHAVKDGGSYLNGVRLNVSGKEDFKTAVIGSAHPNNMFKDETTTVSFLNTLRKLSKQVFAIRLLGPASLQLAYVATGRMDGYIEHGDDIFDWLAGALIVKEAGGLVNTINGAAFGFNTKGIVAATPLIQSELLRCH